MQKNINSQFITLILILALAIVFLIITHLTYQPFNAAYHTKNLVSIHTLLELFSIFVSFTICSYGWQAFKETKSSTFIWIFSIFLVVGLLDLNHTLTYPGMPFFISESSIGKTAWFWVIARITESILMVWFLLEKAKISTTKSRNRIFALSILLVFLVSSFIFVFEKQLPTLIVEGEGPNSLKNGFEYFVCSLQIVAILLTIKRYRETKDPTELSLFLAFSFLLMSEISLTVYQSVFDLSIITGHVYKALGYIFILKAFYFSNIQISFQHKSDVENKLKSTNELLNSFIQYTPDSICIFDSNGRVLKVNEGFEKVFGWTESEVIGKSFVEMMPTMANNIRFVVNRVLTGRSLIGYETTRIRKDGTLIFINMTVSPIHNEQGVITRFVSITRDMTNQRKIEQRTREAEQELKEAVRKQQGIIFKYKKISNRFIHTLCDGELLYDMHLSSEQIVGKEVFDHFQYSQAQYIITFYERAWQGEDVSFEIKMGQRIIYVTLKPIRRLYRVYEVIGSCADITQLKKTEDLLQKSEKLAVVGELAAGFAHEIRNPLTTLKGFTQLMYAQVNPESGQFVDLMLSELDRIEMITNEFMVVAKPQATKYEEMDLRSLLEKTLMFSRPQALLNNVQLDVLIQSTNALIYCDGNQIKQVFINLIKNAIEAMPGGGRISIEVTETEDHHILIRIIDTGCGIPKGIIPRLGEPFYTLKEKGTGLGLMVSFRIIEAHHGTIEFQSEENSGTTVLIKLPLIKERVAG